jgi:hypothetical protein
VIRNRAVKVFPVGEPDRAAVGVLTVISTNRRAAAVEFNDAPDFLRGVLAGGNIEFATRNGVTAILLRRESAKGSWTDIESGFRYELQQ